MKEWIGSPSDYDGHMRALGVLGPTEGRGRKRREKEKKKKKKTYIPRE